MDLSPPFFPACESNLTPYLASRDIVLSLCSCRSVLALSGSPISWQVARAVVVAMNPAFAPTTAAARRGLLIAFTRRGCLLTAVADVVVALLSSSKTASWRLLILSPLALPRLALPRADRGVGVHHRSVRPALALWLKPSPDGLRLWSRERGRLRRAFDDLRRLPGPPRQIALNRRDRVHNLVFRHRLDPAGVLDRHFARHQQNQ